MIRNYFKIAVRNLKRNLRFSVINILGLTLGLAISLLILLFVFNELTYDSYHKDADRIYRIYNRIDVKGGGAYGMSTVNAPLGTLLVHQYPGVISHTKISDLIKTKFTYKDKSFDEELYYADSSFFQLLTADFIYGNAETALIEPFSLVLTKKTADKFFGDKNPMGELVKADNNKIYKVTAVIKDIPENSHFKYSVLSSFSSLSQLDGHKANMDGWGWGKNMYKTYIKLSPENDVEKLIKEFPLIAERYLSDNPMFKYNFSLQPMKDIYLYHGSEGSINKVIIFIVIGVLVLLIACINFMNLSTAQAMKRMREVGVKKVFGVSRKQLIKQFLFESILLSFISLVLAITLAEIVLPTYNVFLQKNLSFSYIGHWQLTLGYLLLTIFVGIMAGSYPAFYMSSFKPIHALRGKFIAGSGNAFFRNSLVVFQFAISIALICCALVIGSQLKFISNTDLGFNERNVLAIPLYSADRETYVDGDQIKNVFSGIPEIKNISILDAVPFVMSDGGSAKIEGFEGTDFQRINQCAADENLIDLLEITLIEGRNFLAENSSDKDRLIVNETFLKSFNLKNPIGETVILKTGRAETDVKKFTIVGVVKDFHVGTFRRKLPPLVILFSKPPYFPRALVKFESKNVPQLIEKIKTTCDEFNASWKPEIDFLEQSISSKYSEEKRAGKMFIYISLLAIFIASIGLYGLASYKAKQRTKEFGIKKIFGSGIGNIVKDLSIDFLKLILISAFIAIPVSWYYMDQWLQDFSYHVNLSWWIFALSTLIAMIIAFFTILNLSVKAAHSNPIDTIKYE